MQAIRETIRALLADFATDQYTYSELLENLQELIGDEYEQD